MISTIDVLEIDGEIGHSESEVSGFIVPLLASEKILKLLRTGVGGKKLVVDVVTDLLRGCERGCANEALR